MHRHCDGTNKLLTIAICCATNSYQEEFACVNHAQHVEHPQNISFLDVQKQECFR